jgi:hypothetical protein
MEPTEAMFEDSGLPEQNDALVEIDCCDASRFQTWSKDPYVMQLGCLLAHA